MKFKGKRKISLKEANERLHKSNESFDLIEYDGISKPCKIQCRNCGCILEFASVQSAIVSMGSQCYSCKKIKNLTDLYNDLCNPIKTVGEFIEIYNKYHGFNLKLNNFGYYMVYKNYKKYQYTFIKKCKINGKYYAVESTVTTKHIKLESEITNDLELESCYTYIYEYKEIEDDNIKNKMIKRELLFLLDDK